MAFRRVIKTAKPGSDDWALFWARLGTGEIYKTLGDLSAALGEYRAAREMAERLAEGDPDNTQWQRESWEMIVLDDFAELHKVELSDPLMEEIESLFGQAETAWPDAAQPEQAAR